MGSKGGPESLSTSLRIVVLLTPSLLLGSAFLVLVISLDLAAPLDRKVWSRSALAFATIYTALISINYNVQLTWMGPCLAEGASPGWNRLFLFLLIHFFTQLIFLATVS